MEDRPDSSRSGSSSAGASLAGTRAGLAKVIPRRTRVSFGIGVIFAIAFAVLVTPSVTAERWLGSVGVGTVKKDQPAPLTVRIPAFTGFESPDRDLRGGGVVIRRGEIATADDAAAVETIVASTPRGPLPYLAFFALVLVFGTIFAHHMRRSTKGKLVRVQVISLIAIALLAGAVKAVLLGTAASVLIVPVALFAMLPTLVLDRVVGLATGILAALVVSLLGPFDLGIAILMLVQASTAGLVVAERPRHRWKAALFAGAVTTLFTVATYVLLTYLTTGMLPPIGGDLFRSPWFAAAIGPAIATLIAVPLLPLYQLAVGEITQSKLVELEDLSNPLLKQIAERSPGTWQHSLAMANMAEIAANSIGANGRLVRVGAYYHDIGKSLQPKYFIENLEPGEPSPHDRLPPEVSCDAIFAHVTEGIVHARKAGMHERIVDFMHMHHGNGVLEYFWGKVKEQGNPRGFTIEDFRYPGHPPQSRETAILAICDAVEAASRTLKSPTPATIDSLVQRIVYGKLHLGQLDESGLSMSDLRCVADSLRETIRHANHGRIEYPWQKQQQQEAAEAAAAAAKPTNDTSQLLRLDSLDRRPARQTAGIAAQPGSPSMSMPIELGHADRKSGDLSGSGPNLHTPEAIAQTADLKKELSIVDTAPALTREPASASHGGLWDPPAASQPGLSTGPAPAAKLEWPAQTSVGVGAVPAQVAAPKHSNVGHVSSPLPVDADFEREAARRIDEPLDELPVGARAHSGSVPPGPPPDMIGPQTFAGARKRAATLSPAPPRTSPTVPPIPARPIAAPPIAAPLPQTLPGPGEPRTLAGAVPPERRSGLASGPVANTTLLGSGPIETPNTPSERRRAPTVPSDPPANQPKPQAPLAQRVANLAKSTVNSPSATLAPPAATVRPADWNAPSEPRRGERVSGLPADPPGANINDTLRGGSAPTRLPASPEAPPKFPAEPSIHPDSSAPNMAPAALTATPSRLSGPPEPVELENAITNPPPMRRGSGSSPPQRDTPGVRRLPGILLENEAFEHDARLGQPIDTLEDDIRVTAPRMVQPPVTYVGHVSGEHERAIAARPIEDAGRTEPSLPRVDLPLRAPPTDPPRTTGREPGWSNTLAARVDAQLDEWGLETPVAPPTRAELRTLLGVPDVTKQQSLVELERLHDRTRELQSDPVIVPPRRFSDTHEVDPDDIEASIEVAPRARTRSPSAIGVAKPKKPT